MLNISILDLIFRTIPEGFAFMLAAYAFGRKRIEPSKYIVSGLSLGVIIYLVRMLPINFGVHTIILLMIQVLLSASVNRIEVKRAITAAFSSIIIMFIAEGINVVILDKLFNIKLMEIMNQPGLKLIYGFPSLIIFAIIMFVLYKVFSRRSV